MSRKLLQPLQQVNSCSRGALAEDLPVFLLLTLWPCFVLVPVLEPVLADSVAEIMSQCSNGDAVSAIEGASRCAGRLLSSPPASAARCCLQLSRSLQARGCWRFSAFYRALLTLSLQDVRRPPSHPLADGQTDPSHSLPGIVRQPRARQDTQSAANTQDADDGAHQSLNVGKDVD